MSRKQFLETFKQVRGVDVSKIQKILNVHEERQRAMAELSAILGQDVTFSNDELLQNVADQYALEVLNEMESKMGKVFANG